MIGIALLLVGAAAAHALVRWLRLPSTPMLILSGIILARLDLLPEELLQLVRSSLTRGYTQTECETYGFDRDCPVLAEMRASDPPTFHRVEYGADEGEEIGDDTSVYWRHRLRHGLLAGRLSVRTM